MTHYYLWGNNPVRLAYKNKACKILAMGGPRSVLLEFEDGFKMVTSTRAIRVRSILR